MRIPVYVFVARFTLYGSAEFREETILFFLSDTAMSLQLDDTSAASSVLGLRKKEVGSVGFICAAERKWERGQICSFAIVDSFRPSLLLLYMLTVLLDMELEWQGKWTGCFWFLGLPMPGVSWPSRVNLFFFSGLVHVALTLVLFFLFLLLLPWAFVFGGTRRTDRWNE